MLGVGALLEQVASWAFLSLKDSWHRGRVSDSGDWPGRTHVKPGAPGQPTCESFLWSHSTKLGKFMESLSSRLAHPGRRVIDTERCNLGIQNWGWRVIWFVTEKTFLLPYFGSHAQSDLLKSSTFPEEVGHLITFILLERPDRVVAIKISDFFILEVVKSPFRSILDPCYPGNPVMLNDWNLNKCSNKIM